MLPHLPLLPWPPSYGLLVALGFVAGLLLVRRLGPRVGVPARQVEDVVAWAALSGLLGAKLLLLLLSPREILADPLSLLTQGGVFYGGLVAAVASVLVTCWRRGLDPHAVGDACAPGIALAHVFGRVGCFLAGCCWGRACDLPWAVRFVHPDGVGVRSGALPAGWPVHPVQLYEAAGNLVILGVLLAVLRRRRTVGQVWWTYVLVYALMRIGLEELRGDSRGSWLGGAVSTSQVVGMVAGLAALVALLVRSRRGRRTEDVPPSAVASAPGGDGGQA